MASPERTSTPLGSFTSGVDGSSEGGRINTSRLPYNLVLYGVALADEMRRRGYSAPLQVAPAQMDGVWCLKLVYPHDQKPPRPVPERWHGHRVTVERAAPPPPPQEKKPG